MSVNRNDPRALLLARCTKMLNRAVALDEKTAYRLSEIGRCTVAFRLRGGDFEAVVEIDDGHIDLVDKRTREPDVVIEGGLKDFVAMARAQGDGTSLAAGQVAIAGDLATAQQIQNLIAGATFDWEEMLALRFGDVLARQIARGLRSTVQWTRDTHAILERDLGDYLRHEIRLLPSAEDTEQFIAASTRAAEDLERLSARVERLKSRRLLR